MKIILSYEPNHLLSVAGLIETFQITEMAKPRSLTYAYLCL